MHIAPAVHERFVRDFGLNMLNSLTAGDNRTTAHRRAIHVYDERGGVMGGSPGREPAIADYQNLTTGVFKSRGRPAGGVRYRCVPNDLEVPILGAFHTHPALYDEDPDRVRRRIDRLLWPSEMDRIAMIQQYRYYGYEWHFIGCVDIACFHISDIQKNYFHPRFVLRYPRLEALMASLAPAISHYDRILAGQTVAVRATRSGLAALVRDVAGRPEPLPELLARCKPHDADDLGHRVAEACQVNGLTDRQVRTWLERTLMDTQEPTRSAFVGAVCEGYDRLRRLDGPAVLIASHAPASFDAAWWPPVQGNDGPL